MATANQLDRSVDEDRLHTEALQTGQAAEGVVRALRHLVPDGAALAQFLEGFPERYLRTRSPQTVRGHLLAATGAGDRVLLVLPGTTAASAMVGEVTLVAQDRPLLFAELTAVLAAWGLDIVSAEAFSNARGIVVDTFQFSDPYRTLELNPEECDRFRRDLHSILETAATSERLPGLRRARRASPKYVVPTRIEADNSASSHSTLLQVVTQNVPGLLRTVAQAFSSFNCSLEVALVDTEGDMAIDVFYITRKGIRLTEGEVEELRSRLTYAIAENATRDRSGVVL